MSTEYDKDLINREVLAVCDHYLTSRRGEGKRQSYLCPVCGDRNFEVEPSLGYAGCFDVACEVPTSTDALEIIAYFEGKELSGQEFVECLKKGYEILGIAAPEEKRTEPYDGQPTHSSFGNKARAMTPKPEKAMTPKKARPGAQGTEESTHDTDAGDTSTSDSGNHWAAANGTASASTLLEHPIQAWQEHADGSRSPVEAVVIHDLDTAEREEDLEEAELAPESSKTEGSTSGREDQDDSRQSDKRLKDHRVYEDLLKLCRRENRDQRFFIGRGLDHQTIEEGRFGSMSKERCNYVLYKLQWKYPAEELVSVPGFYRADTGQLRCSLYGDYALMPYYDGEGYIRTVEGRFTGEQMGEYDKKYKALLNSGVHLYVHPRYKPSEVVAICEGAIGAMVAARYGFAVAAIKGYRNYRRRMDGDGTVYTILPELEGVDFAGKVVVYIPDVDVKVKSYESVMKSVPDACHWMIERQGGVAKVAMLPEGGKDLDSWILSLDEGERSQKIEELLAEASSLPEWNRTYMSSERQEELQESGGEPEEGLEVDEPEEDLEVDEPEEGIEQPEHGEDLYEGDSSDHTGTEDETSPLATRQSPLADGAKQGDGGEDTDLREYETDADSQQGDPEDPGPTTNDHSSNGPNPATADDTPELKAEPERSGSVGHTDTDHETARSTPASRRPADARVPTPPGEKVLVAVVYGVAAIATTIALQAVFGQWLIWIQYAGLGAGCSTWITSGFIRLRHWQLARRLNRHVEGSDV